MTSRGKGAAQPCHVTNLGHNPVEAVGLVWPPRRTTAVSLTPGQQAAVQAHRRLRIEQPPADQPPAEG